MCEARIASSGPSRCSSRTSLGPGSPPRSARCSASGTRGSPCRRRTIACTRLVTSMRHRSRRAKGANAVARVARSRSGASEGSPSSRPNFAISRAPSSRRWAARCTAPRRLRSTPPFAEPERANRNPRTCTNSETPSWPSPRTPTTRAYSPPGTPNCEDPSTKRSNSLSIFAPRCEGPRRIAYSPTVACTRRCRRSTRGSRRPRVRCAGG